MSSWAVVLSHLHTVTCNHPWTFKQSLFRGSKCWLVCFFLFPRLPILSLLTSIFHGVLLLLLVADLQHLRSALVSICKRRFQSYTLLLLGEFHQIVVVFVCGVLFFYHRPTTAHPSSSFSNKFPLFFVRVPHLDFVHFLRRSIGRFRSLLPFCQEHSSLPCSIR